MAPTILSIHNTVVYGVIQKIEEEGLMTDELRALFDKMEIVGTVTNIGAAKTTRAPKKTRVEGAPKAKRPPSEHGLMVGKCMSELRERFPDKKEVPHRFVMGAGQYLAKWRLHGNDEHSEDVIVSAAGMLVNKKHDMTVFKVDEVDEAIFESVKKVMLGKASPKCKIVKVTDVSEEESETENQSEEADTEEEEEEVTEVPVKKAAPVKAKATSAESDSDSDTDSDSDEEDED